MAKWSKQKYKIRKEDVFEEVEGSVCGQWGIDKRKSQYYVLTHVPSGCRAESAKTMRFLKRIVDTPEFENFDGKNATPLKDVIQRFRNEFGWKA